MATRRLQSALPACVSGIPTSVWKLALWVCVLRRFPHLISSLFFVSGGLVGVNISASKHSGTSLVDVAADITTAEETAHLVEGLKVRRRVIGFLFSFSGLHPLFLLGWGLW